MIWRKSARCALAVHPQLLLFTINFVLLEFGDVVSHVVHEAHLQALPGTAEDLLKGFAGLPHQKLAVAPGENCGGAHPAQINVALPAADPRAKQLLNGQVESRLSPRGAQRAE